MEGFYGTPWSHAERLDMLSFMKRHGFNAYFYSPKDDPYLRERWQEAHPAEQIRRIEELIRHASERGLSFFYCLSPGLSMEYSNESHLRQLLDKYHQMYGRGVRHFGLLFDDIPMTLLHGADLERFEHLAEAHAYVIGRVWEQISAWPEPCRLVICPTLYHGLGNEPYITFLGRQLPAEIAIFWTGRFVCSPYLTEGDAAKFREWTGHRPLFWDNYPVNDLAMADELHIGPLLNRDPGLHQHASGYVANAMEYAESSKIPLITIADYLRDPERYDPYQSWERAIAEVAGTADSAHFRQFADNVQSSFLNDQESGRLMAALLRFRFQFMHGEADAAVQRLKEMFIEMEQTADHLLHRMENKRLAAEVKGWVEKYLHWAKVGQTAAALIEAGSTGRIALAAWHLLRFKWRLKRAERLPQKVCGSVMKLFADLVLQEAEKRGGAVSKAD
jgi:hyaluronoglucosaminidase